MVLWKILAIICAVSVFAESSWDHRHRREIFTSICDPAPNNTNKVLCYCSRLNYHPDQISTAECYQTANNLSKDDHSWNGFKTLQNITKLTLTNTRGMAMEYIPTNALVYTKALFKLNVKYCTIDIIHPYAFANLSLLEDLMLRDNQIKTMAANAFSHHARLRTISLDQNNIGEINRDTFIDLPALEQLFLTANKITTIHDKAFVHLTNLKELEIDKNKIFSLNSETFSGLRNLEKLELSSNSLEVVGDNTFAPLVNLRSLNLGYNQIQMLDEKAFNGLANLQALSLEHNKISTLTNEKVFDSLQSLTSLSLKDNELSVIKPEVILPLLSNFYRKSSLLNIDGNKLICDCQLDVFKTLLNQTQNSRLSLEIQNLQCRPTDEVKHKWDKFQEKNSGQVFEDAEPQGESTAYEYYDETELNGTLFYFDMRFILNCSGEETNTQHVPEIHSKPTTSKIESPHINPVNEFYTKSTSSPTHNIISTTVESLSKKYVPIDVRNEGTLDLSLAEATTETLDMKEKGKLEKNNNINLDASKVTKQNSVDNKRESVHTTTRIVTDPNKITKQNSVDNKEENVYTTTRLATVSAKPIESNHYDDRDMASDEAKPDRLKSHDRFVEEMADSSKFKSNSAPNEDFGFPLLVSVNLIVFSLGLFL